ncbi:hypothetical protein SISSUDRAFT_1006570 [Sistotremastrum suecicum HHB10207 ss-3]|uniref:polynucleotide adenylyltransferase n=1 Tax=Sistotremastrum suecicum HHB10207 ss-3 TaxID=1314776 RepID=A0A166C6F8_9AGAM|nr:hypothetical protein SISSUDRAFT_1006570 [Sistotremastrum suecicum HHB10207 ss-3]
MTTFAPQPTGVPSPEHGSAYSLQQSQRSPNLAALRSSNTKAYFCHELSQCLYDFVLQLLPTAEELDVKEDVRKLLEKLIQTLEPSSRLLSFGSTANGFSLRNSDMDLCCLIDAKERPNASDLVQLVGDLLKRETKFEVKPLPHARIPIVKLSLSATDGLPFGIACDIGFENRLALENTRLLYSYACIDPTRVRIMVLFLKVWSKRRKINSPYRGTLSSYGYVLLVIYFLVHVKNPPVLPNLQQIPPLQPITHEEMHIGEHNIWFFDDVETLRQRWRSQNHESVAELLIDFFKYYSRDFLYNTGVASIRAGLLKKESKGWLNEPDPRGGRYQDLAQERNRLCIEDPFENDYNVARCVTRDGLYLIRGEFMRASRILLHRPERAITSLAELCAEREDDLPLPTPTPLFTGPPRLAPIPAQNPYTIGSGSHDLRRPDSAPKDRLSPPRELFEVSSPSAVAGPSRVNEQEAPEHMAPKRAKWTSPPPAGADAEDLTSFESRFGRGLQLATASSEAREKENQGELTPPEEGLSDDDATSDIFPSDNRSIASVPEELPQRHDSPLPSHRSVGQLAALRAVDHAFQVHVSPATPRSPRDEFNRGRATNRSELESESGSLTISSQNGPRATSQLPELETRSQTPRRSLSGPSSWAMGSEGPSSSTRSTQPSSQPSARSPTVSPIAESPTFVQGSSNAGHHALPHNYATVAMLPARLSYQTARTSIPAHILYHQPATSMNRGPAVSVQTPSLTELGSPSLPSRGDAAVHSGYPSLVYNTSQPGNWHGVSSYPSVATNSPATSRQRQSPQSGSSSGADRTSTVNLNASSKSTHSPVDRSSVTLTSAPTWSSIASQSRPNQRPESQIAVAQPSTPSRSPTMSASNTNLANVSRSISPITPNSPRIRQRITPPQSHAAPWPIETLPTTPSVSPNPNAEQDLALTLQHMVIQDRVDDRRVRRSNTLR